MDSYKNLTRWNKRSDIKVSSNPESIKARAEYLMPKWQISMSAVLRRTLCVFTARYVLAFDGVDCISGWRSGTDADWSSHP